MSRAQEGHHLVAHRLEAEPLLAGSLKLQVVADQERDDIFVRWVGGVLLLLDDLRGLPEDDIARRLHVAVHLCGEVFGHGPESLQPVQNAGRQVKHEHGPVCLAERRLGVLKGVDVRAEPGLPDDVECGPVKPLQHLEGLCLEVVTRHLLVPELRHQKGLAPEDRGEVPDRTDGEAGGESLALVNVRSALSQQNPFSQNAKHPLPRPVRLGVVVGVLDGHVSQGRVLRDGKSLRSQRKEIPDDRAILLVPLTLGDPDFLSDDGEKLAPEREPRNGRYDTEGRDVERIYVRLIEDIGEGDKGICPEKGFGRV